MKAYKLLPIALFAALFACSDDISQIGTSLDISEIEVTVDSAFAVSMKSVDVDKIYNCTPTQMLGNINVPNYGYFSSEFMCQLYSIPDWTLEKNVSSIDSMVFSVRYRPGFYIGDSLAPMQMEVYQLQKNIMTPAFSNANPDDYYKPAGVAPILLGRKSYTASDYYNPNKGLNKDTLMYQMQNGSIFKDYFQCVRVTLDENLTQKFYNEYKNNPSTFSNISKFANFFPGIYVRNSFGAGNVLLINDSYVRLHYKVKELDKIVGRVDSSNNPILDEKGNQIMDTTYRYPKKRKEILLVNSIVPNVNLIKTTNSSSLDIAQDAYIKAPASIMTKVTFPTRDIISRYKNEKNNSRILNMVRFIVSTYEVPKNDYSISAPSRILFIREKDYEKFFLEGLLPDGKNYFLATFSNKKYDFGNISGFINNILSRTNESERNGTEDDENILLIPVSVSMDTQSSSTTETVKEVNHYLGYPTIVKLNPTDTKVKLGYTTMIKK